MNRDASTRWAEVSLNWLPTLFTIIGTLVVTFSPQINGYLAQHPTLTTIVVGIYAILNHLYPFSPLNGHAHPPRDDRNVSSR